MVKLRFTLSKKEQGTTDLHELYVRVSIRRGSVFRLKTGVMVPKAWWNVSKEVIKTPRVRVQGLREIINLNKLVEDFKLHLTDVILNAQQSQITKQWLEGKVQLYLHGDDKRVVGNVSIFTKAEDNFDNLFYLFVKSQVKPGNREKQFMTLLGKLHRFARICSTFVLDIDKISDKDLVGFENFMRQEHTFFDGDGNCIKHQKYYAEIHLKRIPRQIGTNGIHYVMKRFRTFYNWLVITKHTVNNPFNNYKLPACVYGTPFFISTEERNKLYEFDFANRPALAIQRDIFVFQSNVGCRTCDLYGLTRDNIVGGFIEYIPTKTIDKSGDTVRVPITKQAMEIIKRYEDMNRKELFPFISVQHYNKDIKLMLRLAGIDRIVTILNPITRKNEQHPIYEVATSYMARRDFIGNLYNKVRDPNIIASMTGHSEGSRAFMRYRTITDNIKQEIIKNLE